MPPTRRRPPSNQPPARRPKVAGLRRPGQDQPEQHPERPEELTQRIERVRDEPKPTPPAPPARRPRPRPAPEPPEPEDEEPTSESAVWTEPEQVERPAAEQARTSTYTSGLAARRAARAAEAEESVPEPEVNEPDEPVAGPEAKPARRSTRTTVLVVLGAVTVVCGGLAAWFGVEDHDLTSGVVGGNTALTDTAATSQISGQVTSAINTMFSYDYQNLDKTKTAVQKLLVGNAISQYNQLFKTVEQQAPQQRLVLTTSVVDTGVKMIQGDRASVLVFANQTDVRASDNTKASGGTMFSVQVVRQGGQWKISNIDTFNSTS